MANFESFETIAGDEITLNLNQVIYAREVKKTKEDEPDRTYVKCRDGVWFEFAGYYGYFKQFLTQAGETAASSEE
jgi:hypothetical protein